MDLELWDAEWKSQMIRIATIHDIYNYQDQIRATVSRLDRECRTTALRNKRKRLIQFTEDKTEGQNSVG
jgi:hypothetical protein